MMRAALLASIALAGCLLVPAAARATDACPAFLDHEFRRLHSPEAVNLCAVSAGKPLLVVNTASHCGFTPQFKGLEALHQAYGPRGLVVVGFPSDDFRQEADDEAETATICYANYGVTFTMLSTSPVKGAAANPVFAELNRRAGEPNWNFNKYLVSADGRTVRHFDSDVKPESKELNEAIEAMLR